MTKQCFRNLKSGDVIEVNGNYLHGKHKPFLVSGRDYKPDFGNILIGEKFYVFNCTEVVKDTFCAIAFKNQAFTGSFITIYECLHEWFNLIDNK